METNDPRDSAASDTRAIAPSAISQLPTELLAEVIRLVLPPVDLASALVDVTLRSYMQILYALSLVMKRWHEIIDGTPTFWTFIHSTLPSHINNTIIQRSNNGPLAIVYSTAVEDRHPSPRDFLQGIAHTYPRWSAYSGPAVRGYLETRAPLLRHISLKGGYPDVEPWELLWGCSTNLRYVELSQVSMRWRTGLFAQLKVLKLRHVGGHGLTASHLLDFLQASPRLEHLELMGVSTTTTTTQAYSPVITLHHLRSIILSVSTEHLLEFIFHHIRAPFCVNFSAFVSLQNELSVSKFLDETLQHFHASLRAIHRHVGCSGILHGRRFHWSTPARSADDYKLFVSIAGATPITCIRSVERILRNDSGLAINLRSMMVHHEAVLETIASMRCVTKIIIGSINDREVVSRTLRFFGQPLRTKPSLPSLPCLRELRLTTLRFNAQDLLDMVKLRFDTLSWDTMERSFLSIAMSRESFSREGSSIPDYAVLSKIRNITGVESVRFFDLGSPKGMLAVIWDEEASKPSARGTIKNKQLTSLLLNGSIILKNLGLIEHLSLYILTWPTRLEMETDNPHADPLPATSQLPTELLAEVLHLVLPPIVLASDPVEIHLHSYMRTLYRLRFVTKRWHDIIDGTPTFWAFVLSTLPSHVNDTIILRSKNCPLAIVYSTASGNGGEHTSPESFLRGVVQTYTRWSAYHGPVVREYLKTPAPRLRHISLAGRFDDVEPWELLGGHPTSLRHVDLFQVPIQWKMGLFTQLDTLKLRLVGQNGLTTGHLLDFLQASPCLEHLELEGVCATTIDSTYSPVITLPRLRSIRLSFCANHLVETILHQIRAPSCFNLSTFVICMHVDEPDLPKFLDETLQPFHGSLRAIHRHVGFSEILPGVFGFQWRTPARHADDHEFCVSIAGPNPSPIVSLSWVERILQNDSGLSIDLRYMANLSGAVLETIAPMRCVTNVTIGETDGREDTLRILRFFGQPLRTKPSLPSLPCLRELRLAATGWDAQDLLDMVNSRFDTFSWSTMERPLLSIAVSREAFSWVAGAQPILDYAVLRKIRNTNGVETVRFSDLGDLEGMRGITWDEGVSKPVWC